MMSHSEMTEFLKYCVVFLSMQVDKRNDDRVIINCAGMIICMLAMQTAYRGGTTDSYNLYGVI